VDSGDIDTGSPFAEAIEKGVEDSSLLCLLTDHYSSREWCRKEIILAKQHQRPVVVVAAFSGQEVRSFPYIGNVPVYRWPCTPGGENNTELAAVNRAAAVATVDLMLKETLQHLHATALLRQIKQEGDEVFTRPPELLSLLCVKGASTVLYPDPPLGREELELLSAVGVPTTTPLSRLAAERPLRGTQIALSMSESTDIQRFGFDELPFKGAMIELSRYLLLKGATLVYGGHLGDDGYTRVLFELVRTYHGLEGIERVERIVNTVGWPLPHNVDLVAEYSQVARLKRIDRPADLNTCPGKEIANAVEAQPLPADQSVEYRYCWARGMTYMRESQVAEGSSIAARIILGGKFGPPEQGAGSGEKWYAGRVPGVLEEVVLSAQAGLPDRRLRRCCSACHRSPRGEGSAGSDLGVSAPRPPCRGNARTVCSLRTALVGLSGYEGSAAQDGGCRYQCPAEEGGKPGAVPHPRGLAHGGVDPDRSEQVGWWRLIRAV
jgi:hypothetical protein